MTYELTDTEQELVKTLKPISKLGTVDCMKFTVQTFDQGNYIEKPIRIQSYTNDKGDYVYAPDLCVMISQLICSYFETLTKDNK